jgi:hypothetical protein
MQNKFGEYFFLNVSFLFAYKEIDKRIFILVHPKMSKETVSKKYTLFLNHLLFLCDNNNNINLTRELKNKLLQLSNELEILLEKIPNLDDSNQSWNWDLEWAYESILENYFLLINYK